MSRKGDKKVDKRTPIHMKRLGATILVAMYLVALFVFGYWASLYEKYVEHWWDSVMHGLLAMVTFGVVTAGLVGVFAALWCWVRSKD